MRREGPSPPTGNRNALMVDVYKGEIVRWNKDFLRQEVHFFSDWAAQEGVPLYFGEIGVTNLSRESDAKRYLSDMLAVLNEMGAHWTYFCLRDDKTYLPDMALVVRDKETPDRTVRPSLINVLKTYSSAKP